MRSPRTGRFPNIANRDTTWFRHWFVVVLLILMSILAAAAVMTLRLPPGEKTWMTQWLRG